MEIDILNETLIELKFQESIFNIKLRVFNKNTSLEINITSESNIIFLPIKVSDTNDEIIIDVLEINNKNVIKKLIIKNKQENADENVLSNIKNIFGNIETSVYEVENVEKVFNNFGNGLSSMLQNTPNTNTQLQQKENENNLNWNIKKKSR